MKTQNLLIFFLFFMLLTSFQKSSNVNEFTPFQPPVSFQEADKRADSILKQMDLDEKIQLVGGFNTFFIKGFEKYKMLGYIYI